MLGRGLTVSIFSGFGKRTSITQQSQVVVADTLDDKIRLALQSQVLKNLQQIFIADALADRIFAFPISRSSAKGFLEPSAPAPDATASIGVAQEFVPLPDNIAELLDDGRAASLAVLTGRAGDAESFVLSPEEWTQAYLRTAEEGGDLPMIFAHELGHLIDLRAGGWQEAWDRIAAKNGFPGLTRNEHAKALIKEAGRDAFPKDLVDDMARLSKLYRPEMWDLKKLENRIRADIKKGKNPFPSATGGQNDTADTQVKRAVEARLAYMNSARELIADTIAMYMLDPALTKKQAPAAAKFVRDLVNDDPKVNPIIQFNVGAPLFGLGLGEED